MRSCPNLFHDTRGVTLVEYLIVLLLVPLAGLAAVQLVRSATHDKGVEVAQHIAALQGGARGEASQGPAPLPPTASPAVWGRSSPGQSPHDGQSAHDGQSPQLLLVAARAPASPSDPDDPADVPYDELPWEDADEPQPRERKWYDGPLDVGRAAWNFGKETAVDLGRRGGALLQATAENAVPLALSTAATAGGVALMVLGAGGEVGGFALDLTGIGAVAGVPIGIVSAGVIVVGATVASTGMLAMAETGGNISRDAQSNYESSRPASPNTSQWNKGNFGSPEDSIKWHFDKHGAEVGAKDAAEYVRKAEGFKQNLRGATKSRVRGSVEGVTRYKKNGRYIDLDRDGNIISFGAQ